MNDEFSVYWWDKNGLQYEDLRFVNVEKAISRVKTLINGPAAKIGIVKRVMITDGGDCTNFEWTKEKGIIFPEPTV